MAALPSLSVPGVPDLDAPDRRHDIVVARAADDGAPCQFPNRPRQHMPLPLPRERGGNITLGLLGFRNSGEPELPEPAISRSSSQSILMLKSQGFQPNAVAFQCKRVDLDHFCHTVTSALKLNLPFLLRLNRGSARGFYLKSARPSV